MAGGGREWGVGEGRRGRLRRVSTEMSRFEKQQGRVS